MKAIRLKVISTSTELRYFIHLAGHHFILYRLTEEGLANGVHKKAIDPSIGVNPQDEFRELDPEDPQALGNFGVDRLFVVGTQTDDTLFQFPEGVGLRIPGDTIFDLNSHYINLLGDETLIGETYINIIRYLRKMLSMKR